ncbi:LEAF RUST 10 DISEASE-RESISTANCE LOCUS RECEPTOR-LIKE PROTEIN KINASE-like 2.2 [Manihot esculenta]|uniref:Protein kinase domain-containing protein n=1 Tax=Manihot esculenta TaxID=3983 RepID=A0A2C9V1S6_MANES|nr:LEAF RUST 10 DISEASE-RESISTANCE LOCUS RECEPTOR-LIKE PROTEIN KINASE-like 2.2 [Manihot esculenta]OAY37641.1 hypothetical protein MANES_11G117300v8 [Manihot esculenta]
MIRETLIFVFLLVSQSCNAFETNRCAPSACGNIRNISYPFRLETDSINCGDHRYNLSCENNSTVLNLYGGKYYVQAINYHNFTIRLVDAGVRQHDCSSIPRFPLSHYHFRQGDPYWSDEGLGYSSLSGSILFLKCQNPVNFSLYPYMDAAPCISTGLKYSYVMVIRSPWVSNLMDLCSVEMMTLIPSAALDYYSYYGQKNVSFNEIHKYLAFGFEISWFDSLYCVNCTYGCYLENNTNRVHCRTWKSKIDIGYRLRVAVYYWLPMNILPNVGKFCALRTTFGALFIAAFLKYKWQRRHLSGYDAIEEFLQNHNNLMPIRYSHSDIKKITGSFKEKLGEGGFGCVYKGKLRSGKVAAIKILNSSKANGQDFINEVATIGRIHHANVVQLIGFCFERSKQALIYEFMPNGSLNNYIGRQEGSISLSWEKLYEISLGVAHGIEYLHEGCDMQILHFDIKPHNVLLDENFKPKISDFGLAKFYPTKGNIASLTAVRGTMGYMAPEFFYKNIGRVSYKADVYSFGMLILEMADKRKNVNSHAEHLSEVHYPFWVHDQLSNGKLPIEDITEGENVIARKIILTGLWCVQMQPCDRPPMKKVIEMLEGDLESLQLPPRPILFPATPVTMDRGELSSELGSSSLIENSS